MESGGCKAFNEYLTELMEIHNVTVGHIIAKTILSKSYVYQVLSGERKPGRDIIIRMALAANFTLGETQQLLVLGERGVLYPKVKRDAVIMCSIQQKRGLSETHEFLASLGEKGLL